MPSPATAAKLRAVASFPPLAQFQAWQSSHIGSLLVTGLLALGLILATQRRAWSEPRVRTLRWTVGVISLIGFVIKTASGLVGHAAEQHLAEGLPCHLCDWAWLAAGLALLTGWRIAKETAVYWGLTLTIQGLLTPDLRADFPSFAFLMFFLNHGLVVATALWLLLGLGGPTRRLQRGAWWRVVMVTELWWACAWVVNALAKTNFGYLAHKPAAASVLDALGPHPQYLFVLQAMVIGAWFALSFLLENKRSAANAAAV